MEHMGIITNKLPLHTLPKGERNKAHALPKTSPPILGGMEGAVILKKPTHNEFKQIRLFIKEYELDDRDLKPEQFTIALCEDVLIGFGRLRKHTNCMELCSLGVVTAFRNQGIGKAIVKKLLENSTKNIYLVCIIPDFFIPFGFREVKEYPVSIQLKLEYCTLELKVPEPYVAMLLQ